MLRMLEAQAPAKQTVTDTISTLSSRLNNATLLEDRRAAILGLRSFAKEYPASVASGSLRGLIGCLTKDLDDVDTIKVVLETLLHLFKPDEDSPEAGEEIALWLADEFTQRQDNIQTLLNLLESPEFYSRFYSLELITAIYSARPERTQECVLNAALGTSRLVATLDDPREPVRNAALVLLADLTQSSTELQKLVAFEGTFDRIFQLVKQEGGLGQGGIIVQDCLDLLANLVRLNSSNQSSFRESGCVPKLYEALKSADDVPPAEDGLPPFANPQKDKNLWGILAVIRLFLVPGSPGTNINQKVFEKHKLLQQVLNLAFQESTDSAIRSEALYTCGDMIRGNPELQAGFAMLQVPAPPEVPQDGKTNGQTNGVAQIRIIDALLNIVVAATNSPPLNVRLAASECIKAYFTSHSQIRMHFLNRAIEGHLSGEDETANVLSTALREGAIQGTDPYRIWFANVILLHLIWEDPQAKSILMQVSEGDADSGEEVVTCIQTLAGNLSTSIQRDEDERIPIAYLMLLCTWLTEDHSAVNDFLSEGSLLQSLIQAVSTNSCTNVLIKGLCALLLGILYHYSTKDSPIPRRKLHTILITSMGSEKYLHALNELRKHPFIREYEVYSQGSAASANPDKPPPYAYLDANFVEFLKDNFSKFRRAINRDPGIEVLPGATKADEGVDRDLVDSLRAELEERNSDLDKAEARILDLEQKLDTAQAVHRKESETAKSELARVKTVNDALQKAHELEVSKMGEGHKAAFSELQTSSNKQIGELQSQLQSLKDTSSEAAERSKEYYERQLAQARNLKNGLDTKLTATQKSLDDTSRAHETAKNTIEDLKGENSSWKKAIDLLKSASEKKDKRIAELQGNLSKQKEMTEDENTKVAMLEKEVSDLEESLTKLKAEVSTAKNETQEKEKARETTQTELDDLLMVFADVEEKRARDKKRLKELGEDVSEAEDDDEEEEEEEEDEVD